MAQMSYYSGSSGLGSRTGRKTMEFGRTYVVKPRGQHKATIVWLHSLGDNGSSSSQLMENLAQPNIKFICPTAPTRPVTMVGGFSCPAWFDVGEFSDDLPDDMEGLDASAAHIANLLSSEPAGIKVGIGGLSMGGATALYTATCFAQGKFANGYGCILNNLRAVVCLSGWLPSYRNVRNRIMAGSNEASRRASSLPVFIAHGLNDDAVPHTHGERAYHALNQAGFHNLSFKTYEGVGHYTVPKEMEDVCNWLSRQGF